MEAISLYRGNLHRVPDVPRQWLMPIPKFSLKDFKTLLLRRNRALFRVRSTSPHNILLNPNPKPETEPSEPLPQPRSEDFKKDDNVEEEKDGNTQIEDPHCLVKQVDKATADDKLQAVEKKINSANPKQVTICQQCGDKGLSDALVYCYYCRDSAVHRYCLHVLPATFKELVIWYCEDCQSKAGKQSTVYNPMSLLPGTIDFRSLRTVKAAESVSRLKKKALNRSKNKLERDVSGSLSISEDHSGKFSSSNYLEVHCCENVEKHQNFRRCRELNGRSSDEEAESVTTKTPWVADCDNTSDPEQSCELSYNESANKNKKLKRHVGLDGSISDEKGESVKTTTSVVTSVIPNTLELDCHDHKHRSTGVLCSQTDTWDTEYQKQKGLVRGGSDEETESVMPKTLQEAISEPSNYPKPISYIRAESVIEVHCNEMGEKDQRRRQRSLDRVSDEEAEPVEAKISLTSASKPSYISKRSRYIPAAEPQVNPIWNGYLSLSNGTYGTFRLVAHLSSLACSKVVEEAKLLPSLLCMELLPKSNIWPKSFEKWGPIDYHIALFLFPSNEREEMVYERLVDDMISRDLGMRTQAENAEMLVFTSKILPSQFWRIQGKFYLWGLFRRKQAAHIPNVVVPREVKDTNNFRWYGKSPVSPLSGSGSYDSVY